MGQGFVEALNLSVRPVIFLVLAFHSARAVRGTVISDPPCVFKRLLVKEILFKKRRAYSRMRANEFELCFS